MFLLNTLFSYITCFRCIEMFSKLFLLNNSLCGYLPHFSNACLTSFIHFLEWLMTPRFLFMVIIVCMLNILISTVPKAVSIGFIVVILDVILLFASNWSRDILQDCLVEIQLWKDVFLVLFIHLDVRLPYFYCYAINYVLISE